MKLAVSGTGYVGLSIATLLAQHNEVWAVDIIPEKVELINQKKSPIQDDYIEKYLAEKDLDLVATLDAESAYRQADFVILDNVADLNVVDVYHCGKKIIKDEKAELKPCPPYLKNTVHVSGFSEERLKLKHPGTKARVIQMLEKQIVTRDVLEEVPWIESDGEKYFAPDGEYQKIAVIERHKNTGKMGVGIIKGYGIRGGAIASSVSHDSHNIIVVGDNDRDMAVAVKEMMRTQGGYTLVCNGEIYGTLPLPVMGLMSDAGYESVNEALAKMIPKAHEMGVKEGFDPFITLSFMALPVIPEIRITPRGIYLVNEDRMLRTPFS